MLWQTSQLKSDSKHTFQSQIEKSEISSALVKKSVQTFCTSSSLLVKAIENVQYYLVQLLQ